MADDADAVLGDLLAGLGALDVAAHLGGHVDDHAAGLHAPDHLLGHELRRGTSGNECRGDDEVGIPDALGDELGLTPLVVIAHLRRIAAGRLGLRLLLFGHLDLDEGAAERFDLLLDDRAHVGGLDDRAEPAGRPDGHQAGHAGAHDDPARRADRAGRGGQQREELRQPLRGQEDRLVATHRGLAGEGVHRLGAGDARDGIHADGGHAALRQLLRELRPGEGAQGADEDRSRAQHLDLLVGGPADAEHHVRLAVQLRRVRHDRRAGLAVGLVEVRAREAGAGLDQHLVAVPDQLAGDLGRERDARFAVRRLAWNTDLHEGSSLRKGMHAANRRSSCEEGARRFGTRV